MRRILVLASILAVFGCAQPTPIYVPTPPPAPVPPNPTPTPTPDPVPVVVDELARAKWDLVTVGMTEAQVVAVTGKPSKRAIVGPGQIALGFYVVLVGKGRRYVEVVLGQDGRAASKVEW